MSDPDMFGTTPSSEIRPRATWLRRVAVALVTVALAPAAAAAANFRVPADGSLEQGAAQVPNGGIIEVSPGTYSAPGSLGFRLENLNKSFTIMAASPGSVVLSGGNQNPVMRIANGGGGTITFKNLTFKDGRGQAYQSAGGVSVINASAVFEGCSFRDNRATGDTTGGGAILAWASSVMARASSFTGNDARTEGGAIVAYAGSFVAIDDSELLDNTVTIAGHRSTSAGGAVNLIDSNAAISRTRFESNRAGFAGGAIYGFSSSWSLPFAEPKYTVSVDSSSFEGNLVDPAFGVTPPEATQGGAIHVENQVELVVRRSRFVGNSAEAGGAVNGYRAHVVVEESIFASNRAIGTGYATGWGGAIGMLSGDLPADSFSNRPTGTLEVIDTLIDCALPGGTSAAQFGGGIFASGDQNRLYGNGVSQQGSAATNRMNVGIFGTTIVGCEVRATGGIGGTGVGAGFELHLVELDMADSIVADNRAVGSQAAGGGGRVVFESRANITNVAFAGNRADRYGAGLSVHGSEVYVDGSEFIENSLSPGVGEPIYESFGAAIYSDPVIGYFGTNQSVKGVVANSVFVHHDGLAVLDNDTTSNPFNDLRYNGNVFREDSFGSDVYLNVVDGPGRSVGELDGLVIQRSGGAPSTDKSSVQNTGTGSTPKVGRLLSVPGADLGPAATGGSVGSGDAYLAYVWSGNNASLDGAPLSAASGIVPVEPGVHTLVVDGQHYSVEVESVGNGIFSNGFENGLGAWSTVVGG